MLLGCTFPPVLTRIPIVHSFEIDYEAKRALTGARLNQRILNFSLEEPHENQLLR